MKNDKIIKSGLPKFKVNEEVNQKIWNQVSEKEGTVISLKKHNKVSKWLTVACCMVLVLGSATVVDAATGGHVRMAVTNLFNTYVFSNGNKIESRTYQDQNGVYVLEYGNEEHLDIMKNDGSYEQISDVKDGEKSMGFITSYDDNDEETTIITSTHDDEILRMSFKLDEDYLSGCTLGIPKDYDNEDKEWLIRSFFVERYFELDKKEYKRAYLKQLKRTLANIEKDYMKTGIEKALEDCKLDGYIIISDFPIIDKKSGETIDRAWLKYDASKLSYKEGMATKIIKSVAGYKAKIKVTVKKGKADNDYMEESLERR